MLSDFAVPPHLFFHLFLIRHPTKRYILTSLCVIIIGFDLQIPEDISLDPRPEYYRGCLTWQKGDDVPTVYGTGSQMSSRLLSMKSANVLLMLPPRTNECSTLKANTVVDAIVIGEIF